MQREITAEYVELFIAIEKAINELEKIRLSLISSQLKAEELFVEKEKTTDRYEKTEM